MVPSRVVFFPHRAFHETPKTLYIISMSSISGSKLNKMIYKQCWRTKFLITDGYDTWPSVCNTFPLLTKERIVAVKDSIEQSMTRIKKKFFFSVRSTPPTTNIMSIVLSAPVGFLIIPRRESTFSSTSTMVPGPPQATGLVSSTCLPH